MPVRGLDFPVVSRKRGLGLVRSEVVDFQCSIIARRDILLVVWRKCKIADRLGMCLDVPDVVKVRLPELYNAIVVCRNQPFFAVRVYSCSDCRIVCLDSLSLLFRCNYQSLTRRMVSKLKAMPFHKVNSPSLEHVKQRLPSGVQRTTFMGCFILLREE